MCNYAPTITKRDEVKEQFFDDLSAVIQSTSLCDKLILLGDLNTRVGHDYVAWKKGSRTDVFQLPQGVTSLCYASPGLSWFWLKVSGMGPLSRVMDPH